MIVSTSSHYLQLTDDICASVEDTVHDAFGHLVGSVVSVDARLERVPGKRKPGGSRVIVRVDMLDHRVFVAESEDDELSTAVWRAANEAVRLIERLQHQPRKLAGQQPPAQRLTFDRCSAARI